MGMLYTPRPLIEMMPITDIYADGIGEIENLGDCFRMIYFTYSQPFDGGPMERIAVAKLVRPKKTILTKGGEIAKWIARSELRIPEPEIQVLHG